MAGIIPGFAATGQNVYAFLRDAFTGQIWNGTAMEVYNQAHWSNYVVALAEQAGSGFYTAGVPGALPASRYIVEVFLQVGGSPVSGDTPIWDTTSFDWDGANVIGLGSGLNVGKINGSSTAASFLATSANTFVTGAAALGTLTQTQMTTNLTGSVANMFAGRVLIFTSGANAGIAVLITAYAVTGGKLTMIAYNNAILPVAPSAGDTFIIF